MAQNQNRDAHYNPLSGIDHWCDLFELSTPKICRRCTSSSAQLVDSNLMFAKSKPASIAALSNAKAAAFISGVISATIRTSPSLPRGTGTERRIANQLCAFRVRILLKCPCQSRLQRFRFGRGYSCNYAAPLSFYLSFSLPFAFVLLATSNPLMTA